jgi:hypothetical protein
MHPSASKVNVPKLNFRITEFSEVRLCREVLQEPHRGLSPLVFDRLPSPSIDSLDPDIALEYDGCPGEDGAQATRGIVV